MKKLLITGVPGTGKIIIGNYLESNYGFIHFDCEDPSMDYNAFSESNADNKVITWGFVPTQDDQKIIYLQTIGYKMIWFDGNRDAARKAFNKRSTVPEYLFDIQMRRIEEMDLNKFKPLEYDTFDSNSNHKDKDIICRELLAFTE